MLKIVLAVILMTIKSEHLNIDNILIDENPCENISVYNISVYSIRFDKVDGFIRVYDGTI